MKNNKKIDALYLEIDRAFLFGYSSIAIYNMYSENVKAQQYIIENHLDEELEMGFEDLGLIY